MTFRKSHFFGLLLISALCFSTSASYGQRTRLLDHNPIGWYVYNGTHTLSQKWTLNAEYQWRRIDFVRTWQQSLARLGLTYNSAERVKLGVGYTYFVTFPFGDYPQADLGVPYPEHRLHEDISLSDTFGRLKLVHRFRLEQRWLAQLANKSPHPITEWEYQNRIRYQISGKLPLKGPTISNNELYLNFFDELFIGFGQNVGENIFNQNRISAGLGYQVYDGLQIELNYLNQVLQHADLAPVTGQRVFEINNGFRLNINHTFDFRR